MELPRTGTPEEKLEALKAALANAPVERLKWQVLRAFGALPTERRARRMTDRDYLWCALNLMLDAGTAAGYGSAPDGETEHTGGQNAAFDEARYLRLSRGEKA